MIVRERKDDFVMIEQHEHAKVSGHLFRQLKKEFAPTETYASAIEYAIFNHDCGWIPFDKAPFWNDEKNSPYSFTNFPTAPKAILYEYGIAKVAEHDLYAALLCSEHYYRFLQHDSTRDSIQFLKNEENRVEKIKEKLQLFDNKLFLTHYELLQFFDNLSLYICLNEPGHTKEEGHPFFKHGIKLPASIGKQLLLHWNKAEQIIIDKKILKKRVSLSLKQKVIPKTKISKDGLQRAYDETTYDTLTFTFI